MMLENKLNITDQVELAREEERVSKGKAKKLFETNYLDSLEAGTFDSLKKIHKFLFGDIYDFAGEIRKVNIAKGNFRFASLSYLEEALKNIEKMPQSNFDEEIAKTKYSNWVKVGNPNLKIEGSTVLFNDMAEIGKNKNEIMEQQMCKFKIKEY